MAGANKEENLGPAYVDEDIEIDATVTDASSSNGWTVAMRLWGPDGTEIVSGVSCTVSTSYRVVTVVGLVTGLTLAAGLYYYTIRRTDTASRTLISHGYIRIYADRPSADT